MLSFTSEAKSNHRTTDRLLVLEPEEGKKAQSSKGLDDPRLFSGENKLHALMDPETCLWGFKYDKGMSPPQLKDVKFTTFNAALKHASDYYKKRNIIIKEVID